MAQKRNVTRNNLSAQAALDYGKVPPQAIDLEEGVLGALMLEKEAYETVSDILKPEAFYKEAHQKIFKAIQDLVSKEKPVDMLTVTEQLRKNATLEEVGGPYFISQLTSKVASAAHIEFHARIIAQKFLQRELIRVATEIQTKAFDDTTDVDDLLDESEASLFEIAQRNIKKDATQINPVIEEAIELIKEASQKPEGLSGVPSGFTALDRITSGWQPSDMVVLAARPSMGKTAFILSMARNMAVEHDKKVAVFSLEMSNVQLVNRLIVSETELSSEKIRNGKLESYEWEQLEYKIKNLVDAPIYVDDTPGLSVFELRGKCRRLKKKFDIDIVIIDYLQLMTASGMTPGSREQEVSLISRSLKGLAKELNVPIIALSQLNRSVESRAGAEGKRPQLSDLRESGAIEQDADMVLFIHRPERYGITEDAEGNSLLGIADIIIAKHRNGAVGDVRMRFKSELARFMDLEEEGFSPYMEPPQGDSNQPLTLSSKMNNEDSFSQTPEFNQNQNDFMGGGGNNPPF